MKNLTKLFLLVLVSLAVTPLTGSFVASAGVVSVLTMLTPNIQGSLYMAIPVQDAQGLFTKSVIAVYKEKISVTSFLRSFFTVKETMSKNVSVLVRRGFEKVAVDVNRYSDGNRNQMTKSTEKIITPPFYSEYLTANEFELYDRAIMALSQGDTTFFTELTQEVAEELMELQKKIERAVELQCAQVFEDGILQLNSGGNIDFKRKAGSKVDKGAGNYWATGTINPYADLEAGCNFIRKEGKSEGFVFDALMGSTALSDFLNNDIVKERADIRNYSMDSIGMAQKNAVGATYHGEVTCGSYRVRLWAYPQYYTDSSGTQVSYLNPKKVVLLPENPEFILTYAAVPQLIEDGQIPQKGAYLIQDFIDRKKVAHEISIKAAPLAVPVAVDRIYTVQVVA